MHCLDKEIWSGLCSILGSRNSRPQKNHGDLLVIDDGHILKSKPIWSSTYPTLENNSASLENECISHSPQSKFQEFWAWWICLLDIGNCSWSPQGDCTQQRIFESLLSLIILLGRWWRQSSQLVRFLDLVDIRDFGECLVIKRHRCSLNRAVQVGRNGFMCYLRRDRDLDHQQVFGWISNTEPTERFGDLSPC